MHLIFINLPTKKKESRSGVEPSTLRVSIKGEREVGGR